MQREFKISEPLLQSVVDYLAQRPYAEVYKVIPALQALPLVAQEAKPAGSVSTSD